MTRGITLTAMTVAERMSAEEFLELSEHSETGLQLVEGEVVVTNPMPLHNYVQFDLVLDTTADTVLVFRRSRPDAPTFDVALELDREQQLTSPLLPGFVLSLAELFPRS